MWRGKGREDRAERLHFSTIEVVFPKLLILKVMQKLHRPFTFTAKKNKQTVKFLEKKKTHEIITSMICSNEQAEETTYTAN